VVFPTPNRHIKVIYCDTKNDEIMNVFFVFLFFLNIIELKIKDTIILGNLIGGAILMQLMKRLKLKNLNRILTTMIIKKRLQTKMIKEWEI